MRIDKKQKKKEIVFKNNSYIWPRKKFNGKGILILNKYQAKHKQNNAYRQKTKEKRNCF